MEALLFCMEIIKREAEKFNIAVNTTTASHITAATAGNINYDIALNRCSYLYRCGAINLSFAKDCFSKFFSDYKSIVFLLSKWINCPNLTLCSLSKGPALDYLAFLSSYKECGMFPSLFKDIKVVTKYGAWRNTVNIMHQIVTEGYLKSLPSPDSLGNIEVIQGDPFEDFSQKVEDPISNSDVVIMVKKLNLQADTFNQEKIAKSIQEFLAALKPDAILFCIDTKPSVALITKGISLFNGTYLLQPTFMNTSITLEHPEFYKDIFGCFPVISARGSLFVWQKSSSIASSSSPHLGPLMDEVSESVKRLLRVNGDNSCCENSYEKNANCEKLVTGGSHSSTSTHFDEKHKDLFKSNENIKFLAKESENNDLLYVDSANTSFQNSRKISSSSLMQNGFLTCEDAENISDEEMSLNCTSVTKSTQTVPIIKNKSAEFVKIAALTEKVINLTATVNDLLQTNETKDVCINDSCSKHTEGTGNDSASNGYVPNHSSVVSCFHKCHCECPENYICNCSQEENFENYRSDHVHENRCLACSQRNTSVSLNRSHQVTRYNSNPCHELKITGEEKSVPKLVIPLSNLSGDVITQIISLISQSN